eukprot:gb/GECG01016231.1/.p1 GENE.gb/GECG01016231.1/~~gb/GECG01016231.1/.p1  ORF type:complete len:124 (+),score=25.21 gb/GECG01016231.1/:1-372(+)
MASSSSTSDTKMAESAANGDDGELPQTEGKDGGYDDSFAKDPMRPFTEETLAKIEDLRQRVGVEKPTQEEMDQHLDWQLEILRDLANFQKQKNGHDLNPEDIVNPIVAMDRVKEAGKDKSKKA